MIIDLEEMMENELLKMISEIAKIPSFSYSEDRLHNYVSEYLKDIPTDITILEDHSMIIQIKGSNNNSFALCSHLDKIDHDGRRNGMLFENNPSTKELFFKETDDKLIGLLDNSVGVGICLYLAKEISKIEYNRPTLYLLLSSREECGMLGAEEISEYLIGKNVLPNMFITIDTCPRVPDNRGIALYRNGNSNQSIDWFIENKKDMLLSEGATDYLVYGRYFGNMGISSIAIEPAITNMHSKKESCWKTDIIECCELIKNFLERK